MPLDALERLLEQIAQAGRESSQPSADEPANAAVGGPRREAGRVVDAATVHNARELSALLRGAAEGAQRQHVVISQLGASAARASRRLSQLAAAGTRQRGASQTAAAEGDGSPPRSRLETDDLAATVRRGHGRIAELLADLRGRGPQLTAAASRATRADRRQQPRGIAGVVANLERFSDVIERQVRAGRQVDRFSVALAVASRALLGFAGRVAIRPGRYVGPLRAAAYSMRHAARRSAVLRSVRGALLAPSRVARRVRQTIRPARPTMARTALRAAAGGAAAGGGATALGGGAAASGAAGGGAAAAGGTAAAAIGAAGPIGLAAAAVAASVGTILAANAAIQRWTESILQSRYQLAEYSAVIGRAQAERQAAQIRENVITGRQTGSSTLLLTRQLVALRREWQPVKSLLMNLVNVGGSLAVQSLRIANLLAASAPTIRMANDLLGRIADRLASHDRDFRPPMLDWLEDLATQPPERDPPGGRNPPPE